jgi:hypothetical protein
MSSSVQTYFAIMQQSLPWWLKFTFYDFMLLLEMLYYIIHIYLLLPPDVRDSCDQGALIFTSLVFKFSASSLTWQLVGHRIVCSLYFNVYWNCFLFILLVTMITLFSNIHLLSAIFVWDPVIPLDLVIQSYFYFYCDTSYKFISVFTYQKLSQNHC